jgi:hypothetical protein
MMVNGEGDRLCEKIRRLKASTWSRISPVMATGRSFISAMSRSALYAARTELINGTNGTLPIPLWLKHEFSKLGDKPLVGCGANFW